MKMSEVINISPSGHFPNRHTILCLANIRLILSFVILCCFFLFVSQNDSLWSARKLNAGKFVCGEFIIRKCNTTRLGTVEIRNCNYHYGSINYIHSLAL